MMCLIRLSAATPHPASKNFKHLPQLPVVAAQMQKFKAAQISGFPLHSGASSSFSVTH